MEETIDIKLGWTHAVRKLQDQINEKVGSAVADATDASDVVDQLNALLESLRDAGLIVRLQ